MANKEVVARVRARYEVVIEEPATTPPERGRQSCRHTEGRPMKGLGAWLPLLLLAVPAAQAHETRPASLQIIETRPGLFQVLWKVPQRGDLVVGLHVEWPAACRDAVPVTREMLGDAVIEQRLLECGTSGLIGQRLAIEGLASTITDVLARLALLDGRVQTNLMTPGSPPFVLHGRRSSLNVAYEYLRLGAEHILLGIDHVLFVLGLLLIVRDRCLLLKTVTAFTVAHSLTLGVATMGYTSAPVPPLNAAIALRILFLGPKIARSWRDETSFTIERTFALMGGCDDTPRKLRSA
jgi:HupE / UreJ protein